MEIEARDISFTYDGAQTPALKNISFEIKEGEFIAIIGANGSGKSTLARLFNALLPLQNGKMRVAGFDVKDEKKHHALRKRCGMVFQNPDSQFVYPVLEEDVAFALYNYDVEEKKINGEVKKALDTVDLNGFERRSPLTLSGGEKQRAAIAGVIVSKPCIVIFDEALSMLDSKSGNEVMRYIKKINSSGTTVIMITHSAQSAAEADRIFVMKDGEILKTGSTREILSDSECLRLAGLSPPFAARMYKKLSAAGIKLGRRPLNNEELAEEIIRLIG